MSWCSYRRISCSSKFLSNSVVLGEFLLCFTPSSCCPDVWSIRSLLPLRTLTSASSTQCWTLLSTPIPTFTEFLPSVEAESPSFTASASSPMSREDRTNCSGALAQSGPPREPEEWVLPIQAKISYPTLYVTAFPCIGTRGPFLWSYYSEKKD